MLHARLREDLRQCHESGGHAERVRVEGARVGDLARDDLVHDRRLSPDRGEREAATDRLAEHLHIRATPKASSAPPYHLPQVLTSSKIRTAPIRSARARKPSRNPSSGWTYPMFIGTGSRIIPAMSSACSVAIASVDARSLNGATTAVSTSSFRRPFDDDTGFGRRGSPETSRRGLIETMSASWEPW